VAPLRERTEDIHLLASHFIDKYSRVTKRPAKEISADAMAVFMAYGWPGNVRELENVIQRMMIVSRRESFEVEDLPHEMHGTGSKADAQGLKGISRESTGVVEKRTILETLGKTAGNITRAAKLLGVSRATLQNKIKLYGLREPKA
jgi:DNA-binding NtrC family response regulator